MCPIYHLGRTDENAGDRLRLATFRVKCFLWAGKGEPSPLTGFGFAADVSETGVDVYAQAGLSRGASVRIAFDDVSAQPYRGLIVHCQRYSSGRRVRAQERSSPDHRLGILLNLSMETERQRYLSFLSDLRRRATSLGGNS